MEVISFFIFSAQFLPANSPTGDHHPSQSNSFVLSPIEHHIAEQCRFTAGDNEQRYDVGFRSTEHRTTTTDRFKSAQRTTIENQWVWSTTATTTSSSSSTTAAAAAATTIKSTVDQLVYCKFNRNRRKYETGTKSIETVCGCVNGFSSFRFFCCFVSYRLFVCERRSVFRFVSNSTSVWL